MSVRICLAAAIYFGTVCSQAVDWTAPSTNGMRNLSEFLEPFRRKSELPAFAAAVVHQSQIVAAGVTGERKLGSSIPVQLDDKFHIGSCTKSMTALLAADLARFNTITFDTRVGDIFPNW